MFDQAKQVLNASFAPFSHLKMGAIKKAKLLVLKSIFNSILTCGHETWVMTERVQPQMQASEIRTLYVEVRGKRPVGQTQTRWLEYIKNLGWNGLELHSSKM